MTQIHNQLSPFFQNYFFCTRAWSAWSYNTMTPDDFVSVGEDDDFLNDLINYLSLQKEITVITVDNILAEFNDIYSNDNFFYNNNNFNKEDFHDDWTSDFDFEEFVKVASPIFHQVRINNKVSLF